MTPTATGRCLATVCHKLESWQEAVGFVFNRHSNLNMIMYEGLQASVVWDHDLIHKQQQNHQHQDSQDPDGLQSLIQKNDLLDRQLEDERQRHRKLQEEVAWALLRHVFGSFRPRPSLTLASVCDQVSSAEQSLEELRKEVVRGSLWSERQKTQRAIRALEYKLHRASVELNVQLAKNRRLGEELQTLSDERISFQQLQHKLNKELRDVKKKIREATGVCSAADHARVEVQTKMVVTQERKEEELTQTKAEILKLSRVIALKMTLRDFTVMKSSRRSGPDGSLRVTPRKFPKKTQKTRDPGAASVDALREAFEKIQAATGVDDLAVLVNNFIKDEQKIFEQNSFLNVQQAEVTTLREQSSKIQAEIDSLRAEHLQQKEALSVSQRNTEEQLRKVESQIHDYEGRWVTINKILDDFKKGLHNIPLTSVWRQSTETPEDDTATLMSPLEQSTNDLLAVQVFHTFKKQEKNPTPSKKTIQMFNLPAAAPPLE
ncbi:outer dynein arm protein 1 isoform X1 [Oryzias latipes]|uniref:outer dynein arm protein 1 isoform X1 n=1 Tax=Oryzias latipes TaxID=8090 RepID=UPI0005CBB4AC|nr:outer dynein arm protein 1 isoform X1 [Oryzias latipes]